MSDFHKKCKRDDEIERQIVLGELDEFSELTVKEMEETIKSCIYKYLRIDVDKVIESCLRGTVEEEAESTRHIFEWLEPIIHVWYEKKRKENE